jgi:NADH:ubiquinone oxidoreductase subunit E
MTEATNVQGPTCGANEPPVDLKLLDPILEEFKGQKGAVIPILQQTQDVLGYLPRPALRYIAEKTLVPLNQLYGIATFYTQFHLKRRGRHVVRVCDGTACHVRGAPKNITDGEGARVERGGDVGGLQVHL